MKVALFYVYRAVRKYTSIHLPETVLSVFDVSVAKATVYIPELVCKNRNTSAFSVWAKYCNSQQLLLPVLVSSHRDFRFCPFPKCLFYGCPTLGEDTESEHLWSDIVLNVTWHSTGSGRQCHVNMNYSCLTPASMDNWQVSEMWFEAFNTVLINQHLNTTWLPATR